MNNKALNQGPNKEVWTQYYSIIMYRTYRSPANNADDRISCQLLTLVLVRASWSHTLSCTREVCTHGCNAPLSESSACLLWSLRSGAPLLVFSETLDVGRILPRVTSADHPFGSAAKHRYQQKHKNMNIIHLDQFCAPNTVACRLHLLVYVQ